MEDGTAGAIVLAAGGGDIALGGQIEGGYVAAVASRDVIKRSGDSLDVNADSLSVSAGRNIDLDSDDAEFSNARLHVGSGYALGVDTDMITQLQRKYPALVPHSLAPNAGFDAGGTVAIGNLIVDGGYLFVRATQVSAQSISTENNLFYNYRPTSDATSTDVATNVVLPISAASVTLAFGGGGYDGDIDISGPSAQAIAKSFSSGQANYVFMTNGKVNGSSHVQTSGVVAVLAGSQGSNPGEPGGENPPPPDLIALAHTLASVTSNTQNTLHVPELALAPADGEPLIRIAVPTSQCQ
jgi:hypothetical protein